ncbi:MAG: RHS repeat protein [Lysobacter sp.]|nr:MAG: RHS repeat protein [Lysobacter sp.]
MRRFAPDRESSLSPSYPLRLSLASFKPVFALLIFAIGFGGLPVGETAAQGFDPSKFCYLVAGTQTQTCFDTRQDAEVAMRNDPAFGVIGPLLERFESPGTLLAVTPANPTAIYAYRVKERAPVIAYTMYSADLGSVGSGSFGCTPAAGDPDPSYASWCASEANLVPAAEQQLLSTELVGCTLLSTAILHDNSANAIPFIEQDPNNPQRGIIRLTTGYDTQYRTYQTSAQCPGDTVPRTRAWYLRRHTTFICQSGFQSDIAYGRADGAYCVANQPNVAIITGPLQQCDSCAGSPNPIYPATGEKARQEPDFEFAGRTFTRYYHSLGQFRNNPDFAVGWTHTYSDRIDGYAGAASVAVVDDRGYFQSYVSIGNGRYRGDNSVDRVLDEVNDGDVVWRLRYPDGELREFDIFGRLVFVRHPQNPSNDVALTYTDDVLTAVTDAQGRTLRFEYANRLLNRIVKPDGTSVTYAYDADLNLTQANYGAGVGIRFYKYHEATFGDAKFVNHLTGIVNEFGQRHATFKYDNKGRVIESRIHGTPNEVTTAAYPSDTQATLVTANGETRQYGIQPGLYRHLTNVTDSAGSSSSTYDPQGRITSHTDKRGIVTNYEYSASYRSATVEAVGTPEQRRVEITRDPLSNSVIEKRTFDASGVLKAKIAWTRNSRDQIVTMTVTDPTVTPNVTRTTVYAYCEQADVTAGACPFVGLLKSVDGARASPIVDVTTYSYRQADDAACTTTPTTCAYRKGDLWKTTNALGHITEVLSYDGAGRVLSIKDGNDVVTDFEYNARGWLVAQKVRGPDSAGEADDRIARINYLPYGAVSRVYNTGASDIGYIYDAGHRITRLKDNQGYETRFTLNAAGDRIGEQITDAFATTTYRTLTRTIDSLGRVQTQTDAYNRVTGFTYDANGNLDQTTDSLTRVSDNNYDPLDRISRTLQDMNGIAAETKFTYDVLDNLTQVNDPKGLNTNYTYNGFSELKTLQSPDTGSTAYEYDAAGNRTKQTDARGKVTNYGYDALNRLTTVTYPTAAALNTTYTYDTTQTGCLTDETFGKGRLTKIADQSGTTIYCYNRFGDLVRKKQTTNSQTVELRYAYAANGTLSSVTYPDGAVVDYIRDNIGRIIEVGAKPATGTRQVLLTGATYYPFGPAQQWNYGNGRVMQRSLNQNYQPGFVQVNASGGIDVGYEFDEVGNLKKLRAANQSDPPKRLFGYDALNRLTENRDGSTNALLQGYAYDKTGNRTSATIGGTTTTYTYPATNHRLGQIGALATRVYDNNGNTTSAPGTTTKNFVYGDHNRMTQAKNGSTVVMNYVYNGKGEQVRKYLGTTNTYSAYDEAGHWIGDYGNAGGAAPTQQVIWMDDLPVGVFVGSGASQKLHYIEADALGTPRVVVDPTRGPAGTAVWNWPLEGEAFGTTAPNQNPDGDANSFVFNMRFPGQRYDSASGLNYNYFRDYEAAIGRYAESDPIGLKGGMATYSYALSSPLLKSDPFGLDSDKGGYPGGGQNGSGDCRNVGMLWWGPFITFGTKLFTVLCVYDCNFVCPTTYNEIKFRWHTSYNLPVCPKFMPRSSFN